MSKETIVFTSGVLLLVIPFLGIPEDWRHYFVAAMGVILVFTGYALRRAAFFRRIERQDGERATDSFVETTETLFIEQ